MAYFERLRLSLRNCQAQLPLGQPTAMAHETECVTAPTVEVSSQSNHCNRKEGRRGLVPINGDGDDDDGREVAADTDLSLVDNCDRDVISLPSPVAAATDASETFDVTQAMENLALTQSTEKKMVNKVDGLLMLPIFPSSGRIPRTPPSTPEPILMHSPEKELSKVVPMSLDGHRLSSTSIGVPKDPLSPDKGPATVPIDASREMNLADKMDENERVLDHETSLSNALAGISLTNGSVVDSEIVETHLSNGNISDHVVTDLASERLRLPFDADNADVLEANDCVQSLSATLTEQILPVNCTVQVPSTTAVVSEPTLIGNMGPKPHINSSTTSNLSTRFLPNKATSPLPKGQVTTKGMAFEPKPRPIKRKGDATDVTPRADPALVVTSESQSKQLTTRPKSGLRVVQPKADFEPKSNVAVAARPVSEVKNDSMKQPTNNRVARATAAEARKALMKSAAAKKNLFRRSTRTTRSVAPDPPSCGPDKAILAPPAPAVTDKLNDGQRNVKRRLNATDAQTASNRLYANAMETKARKEAKREELQETYTFAPKVNNYKRRMNTEESDELKDDHFNRLHAQVNKITEKKRELQHERDGCTFAPSISRRAKRSDQSGKSSRYENLYKDAQELMRKREVKILEQAKSTEELCPFKPKITSSRALTKTKPLYDFEREKLKRLTREQQKVDFEMSKCTFKPQVSVKRFKSKAESPSGATRDASVVANPFNRLYQGSIDRTERLQKLRQEQDEKEKAQAPFRPRISARSRMLKSKATSKEPFHNRLYNKDYLKQVDAEREQRRLEEEQKYTFKPEIIGSSQEIKSRVNERASPEKNIFERLYDEKNKVKEKVVLAEELRLQKEMAECTFRPQIEVDAVLSHSEPAASVWERLLSYDKAQVIEEREKLKEQLEMQECTFKPEVKSSESLGSPLYDRMTGSSTSLLDPARPSFITTRPDSSSGQQHGTDLSS